MTEKKGRLHGRALPAGKRAPQRLPSPPGPRDLLARQPPGGHGEGLFIRPWRTGEVRERRREKPKAANGFKVKAMEIRDSVFVLEIGSGTD